MWYKSGWRQREMMISSFKIVFLCKILIKDNFLKSLVRGNVIHSLADTKLDRCNALVTVKQKDNLTTRRWPRFFNWIYQCMYYIPSEVRRAWFYKFEVNWPHRLVYETLIYSYFEDQEQLQNEELKQSWLLFAAWLSTPSLNCVSYDKTPQSIRYTSRL